MSKRAMRRAAILIAGLALLIAIVALPKRVRLEHGLGRYLSEMTLRDPADRPVALRNYLGRRATVLVFTGIDCPIGDLYMPRLGELSRRYERRGVAFVAINSNLHETSAQAAEHARAFGLEFPVLKDPENRLADRAAVLRTNEVLILDGRARLCYHGAIDDQYTLQARRERPSRSYLAEALEAVLGGRAVSLSSPPADGCLIDRVDPALVLARRNKLRPAAPELIAIRNRWDGPAPVEAGDVTYARQIAPILRAHCQPCHRPGQVAPFSLLTYEQARAHAAMIGEVVQDYRMPPWHADPRFGRFANDRSLSAGERAAILGWVEQGAPAGEASGTNEAPSAAPAMWTIGTPDHVFSMNQPYQVSAQGILPYQRFRVPTGFTEDVWVQAVEARPGNRAVVHHLVVYIDDHTQREIDLFHSLNTHLASYAPGDSAQVYPIDVAKRIPAGSDLIFEVHYTPIGREVADQSSVGLILSKSPPRLQAFTDAIVQTRFAIPPGAQDFPVHQSFVFDRDAHLLGLAPHMHMRGKSFCFTARHPDGCAEVLLSVPAYDFAWQTVYRLAEPKVMRRGTRIDCEARYDNSAANPRNPDPYRTVTWGEQTDDEMMVGYIDYCEIVPGRR
ncbi:MAG: redoxin domain-containing protein [Isosphaeraceae bacterium]